MSGITPYKKDWCDFCPFKNAPHKIIVHYIHEFLIDIVHKPTFDCSDSENCKFSGECPVFKSAPNY